MGSAIIGGLLARKVYTPEEIIVSEPYPPSATALREKYGVTIAADNADAVKEANIIVLAVKPQILKSVCEGFTEQVKANRPLIISICAGIRGEDIARWLGSTPEAPVAVVRTMPNTPALLGEGAVGMFASDAVTPAQKEQAIAILSAVSKEVHFVPTEALIDTVTAVSGSGPAYFFFMIEAMENAAVKLGMDREVARKLAAQTCVGAGLMVLDQCKDDVDPAELRRRVTSPQGTTEAGVKVLEAEGVRAAVEKCVDAANARGKELGDVFGK